MAIDQSFELSNQHYEILKTLTSKVRVLTIEQIARTFFQGKKNSAKDIQEMLRKLEAAGFIHSHTSMVHPEIQLVAPEYSFTPGDREPDFQPIASRLRSRWNQTPIETSLIYASKDSKEAFGGYIGGKKPRASETRHDIHVTQLYLRLLRQDKVLAKAWVPEEQLRRERDNNEGGIPDALIRTTNPVIIEFGGAYPRAKLEAFHVEHKQQRYEIW